MNDENKGRGINGTDSLSEILHAITIDSKDNGDIFTILDRADYISRQLNGSKYSRKIFDNNKLSFLYEHDQLDDSSGIVLISTHIDCVYKELFSKEEGDIFLGSYDNSATNAIVLYLMLRESFNPNVVIAFTGDEEENGGGADEIANYYLANKRNIRNIIVCDLTNEGWFGEECFTVENIFVDDGSYYLRGQRYASFTEGIKTILGEFSKEFTILIEAEPDETDDYSEFDLDCFTFCLPCKGDMHSEGGVRIRKQSFGIYAQALASLANALG